MHEALDMQSAYRLCSLVRFALLAAAIAAATSCSEVFAWGEGHRTQARMVLDALPGEIQDFFSPDLKRKIVDEYCGYPDTVRSFDEGLLGGETVDELKRMKFGPGDLHEDHNAAVSWLLLSRAFARKEPGHAAVWLGSLIHTVGDNGSHLTLIAYLAELSRFKPQGRIARGSFDLSQAAASPAGKAMLARLMASYTPRLISEDPDEVLRKMLLLAYEEMDYGAQRQSRIGLTFNAGTPEAVRDDGVAALAEVGAHGAQQVLDATVTAWEFAKRQRPVRWTEELVGKARADIDQYLARKPLEHDAVYAGTLAGRPSRRFAGVLVEPSTFMGRARFGYCGAVLLGQIMRTLREAGEPYAAIDIRAVEKEGLPPASQMPVLIVVSGGFYASKEPLANYVAAGGRLLWIGGCDQGLFGKLSKSLQPADPSLLPVSNKYEDANREVVARVSIRFLNEFEKPLGKAPRAFVNNPNTFGWTTPRCGLKVAPGDADIKALAAVSDGADSMIIAAALKEKGLVRHIFLPQYLLLPYTLTSDPPMDCSKPSLDSVGRKIILGSVKMLSPGLSGSGSSASPDAGDILARLEAKSWAKVAYAVSHRPERFASSHEGSNIVRVLLISPNTERVNMPTLPLGLSYIDNQQMGNPRLLIEPVKEIVATCRVVSKAKIVLGGAGFSIFDLLRPRFYVRPGLEGFIREEVTRRYGPDAMGRPIVRQQPH
jgi:hypothetical protein